MNRQEGIGGTDAPAIAGLNPWKGPMDVYLEKLGLKDGPEENEAMYWGSALEPALQKRYERETGYKVANPEPMRHPDHLWYLGSLDGFVEPDGVVEYKTAGWRNPDLWGEPGTDKVPPEYLGQCQWYMGLTGANWADLAVLFMGRRREFVIYRINRDQELIDNLIDIARDFWENNILKETPPPLDASEATRLYLAQKYPKDIGDMLSAPEVASEWFSRLQAAKEAITEAEKEKLEAEAHLKDIIGEAAGLQGDGWKCTWKKSKDRTETDWQKAYFKLCEYCHDSGLFINDDDFSGMSTTIKPGPRVFRVYENKRED